MGPAAADTAGGLDADSRRWLDELRATGARRERAVARLHDLLVRAARFEIDRRRASLPHLRGDDLDDLAMQAAHDALLAVLAKLEGYRGASRFTTWAYKFALLEAAVKLRRRAWQAREVPLEEPAWEVLADRGRSPALEAERREVFAALAGAVARELTPHQREVLLAITVSGVPIDVLAERLNTTRGALYKTLHDARGKLRASLAAAGLAVDPDSDSEGTS